MSSMSPTQLADTPAIPPPPGVTPNFIDPISRSPMGIGVSCMIIFLMIFFFVLRIYSRIFIQKHLTWDDWTCTLALLCTLGSSIDVIILFASPGLGPHMWDVRLVDLNGAYMAKQLASAILYCLSVLFIKTSILLLYLNVFSAKKMAKYFIYFGIFMVVGFYLATMVSLSIFCAPKPGTSTGYYMCDPREVKVILVQSGFNIATDVYLLAIAIPIIFSLHMPLRHKFGVAVVILTGLFATIASILNLHFRLASANSTDVSWDYSPAEITL
jgi:hypothetical protein